MAKKSLFIKIGLILAGLLLVGGVSAAVSFWAVGNAGGQAKAKTKEERKAGVFAEAGEFATNLADPGARRYIKVKVTLELPDEKAKEEADKRQAVVREVVLSTLRAKTAADVAGEEGMQKLAKDLQGRIAQAVPSAKVGRVYITDMAVQ